MSPQPIDDAEHAQALRTAVHDLENKLREAASDGVVVRLSLCTARGSRRNKDQFTEFQSVAIVEVNRPL
jgi:hypothetical protein